MKLHERHRFYEQRNYYFVEWKNDQYKVCRSWEVMKLCSWKLFYLNSFRTLKRGLKNVVHQPCCVVRARWEWDGLWPYVTWRACSRIERHRIVVSVLPVLYSVHREGRTYGGEECLPRDPPGAAVRAAALHVSHCTHGRHVARCRCRPVSMIERAQLAHRSALGSIVRNATKDVLFRPEHIAFRSVRNALQMCVWTLFPYIHGSRTHHKEDWQ
jgi:hypothetical protein